MGIMQQQSAESFFTDLANTRPYFKAGIMGMAGSGKTTTSALLSIALHQRIKSTKPIVIFDTERAAKFTAPYFEAFGIRVLVKESRSLADWVQTVTLCQNGVADILLIDSVTHLWEGLIKAHQEKVKRARLEISDWGVLKPQWKKWFSDPYLDSPLHIVMAGRAGDVWANEVDEESGRRKSFNTGVHKMKVEGETGFEPHLLIDMDLVRDGRTGDEVSYREASIIKDRSNTIDGRSFRFDNTNDPKQAFENVLRAFSPAIDASLQAPAPGLAPTTEAPMAPLLEMSEEGERNKLDRRILLEEIEARLMQLAPGMSAKEKQLRTDTLERLFGSPSWSKVEVSTLDVLRQGRKRLDELVAEMRGAKAKAEGEGLPYEPDPSGGAVAKDRRSAKGPDAVAEGATDRAAEGTDAPSDTEVAVVRPLDDVTRSRFKLELSKALGRMQADGHDDKQWLADQLGYAVDSIHGLSDSDLQTLHKALNPNR